MSGKLKIEIKESEKQEKGAVESFKKAHSPRVNGFRARKDGASKLPELIKENLNSHQKNSRKLS